MPAAVAAHGVSMNTPTFDSFSLGRLIFGYNSLLTPKTQAAHPFATYAPTFSICSSVTATIRQQSEIASGATAKTEPSELASRIGLDSIHLDRCK